MIYKSRFTMEHTNLFLYENVTALQTDYPNGKVDTPVPGVAYGRADANSGATVLYNQKKTNYTVTLSFKDRSGNTVTANTTVQSPLVLEGASTKMNINAPEVDDYKAIHPVEKIVITGDTAHTVLYYVQTSYTVTVHHMYEGSALTADTEVEVTGVFEEDKVKVTIEPETISGYKASPVTITVSGDMEYSLIYSVACEDYTFVDLGLPSGTLWASHNLGANSETDPGKFFAWGELSEKASYDESNYEFFDADDSENYYMSKYNYDDNKTILDEDDDVAHFTSCEEHIYIPTAMDFMELLEDANIEISYVARNGVSGMSCYSYYNGNEIFFPINGFKEGTNFDNNYASYWTSENSMSSGNNCDYAFLMRFGGCYIASVLTDSRYMGAGIRPVKYASHTVDSPLLSENPDPTRSAKSVSSNFRDRRDKPTVIDGKKFFLVRFFDNKEEEGETKSEEK